MAVTEQLTHATVKRLTVLAGGLIEPVGEPLRIAGDIAVEGTISQTSTTVIDDATTEAEAVTKLNELLAALRVSGFLSTGP